MKKLSSVGRHGVFGVLSAALLFVPVVLSATAVQARPKAFVQRQYVAINHYPGWSRLDDRQHGTWHKNPGVGQVTTRVQIRKVNPGALAKPKPFTARGIR